MTGFPSEATRTHARDLGVAAYVTKPFGVHDIVELCEKALRAGSPT
jgi:DNA-binding response OmpR family regulator